MRVWALLLFSLAFCRTVVGQNAAIDSLRREIRTQLQEEELVRKAFDRLADQTQRGDTVGVSLLAAFIETESRKAHIAGLSKDEKIELALFRSQYDSVFALLENYEPKESGVGSSSVNERYIYNRRRLNANPVWMQAEIQKYVADSLERELLRTVASREGSYKYLYFDYSDPIVIRWLGSRLTPRMAQLIERRKFLYTSPYKSWDPFGIALWAGPSYPFHTGRLQNLVRDDLGLAMGLAFQYGRFNLQFNYLVGSGRVLDSLPNKVFTLARHTPLQNTVFEVGLGYCVVNTRSIRIVPMAGVSTVRMVAPSYVTNRDTSLKRGGMQGVGPAFGVELGFKIRSSVFRQFGAKEKEVSWSAVSIRYSLAMPDFQNRYGDGGGLRHVLSLHVGTGFLAGTFDRRRSYRRGFFGGKVPPDVEPYGYYYRLQI